MYSVRYGSKAAQEQSYRSTTLYCFAATTQDEPYKISEALKKMTAGVKTAKSQWRPRWVTKDKEVDEVDVTPKTSHLNAVKRIFKYLKGKPNLGLWYPRESSFDLEAYSDSNYAGS
ncbi:hypothetical protein Tco_1446949 [Tanacetum coccineum]